MREFAVDIPKPCAANWDEMRASDKSRFCADCQTRVHDLSAMTPREAERFLLRNADREDLCLSYVHDEAGAIRFQPPTPRLVPVRRLLRMTPAAGLSLAMAACTPAAPESKATPATQVVDADHATARDAGETGVSHKPAMTPDTAAVQPEPARSLLANPLDAILPKPPRINEDEPCDGGVSKPTADPVETPRLAAPPAAPPRTHHRTAGKPKITRLKGKMRRP